MLQLSDEQVAMGLRRFDVYHRLRELSSKPGHRTDLAVCRDDNGREQLVILKSFDEPFVDEELWRHYGRVSREKNSHVPMLREVIRLPSELIVVLDYVAGEDLDSYVARKGAFTLQDALPVMKDLCDASQALSGAGIVHRDIKPSNIILTYEGAWLIDPGIARLMHTYASQSHDTTVLGTWGYASPEQAGFAETDARSDVFSLGRVLGFMLTGFSPSDACYTEHLRTISRVAKPICEVIEEACTLEPSKRPQDASELFVRLSCAMQMQVGIPSKSSQENAISSYEISDQKASKLFVTERSSEDTDDHQAISISSSKPIKHPVAAWIIGIVAVLFGCCFCIEGFFRPSLLIPLWGNIIYGLAIGIFGNFFAGYEIVSWLLANGCYTSDPEAGKVCAKRVALWWAICLSILMLTSIITKFIF